MTAVEPESQPRLEIDEIRVSQNSGVAGVLDGRGPRKDETFSMLSNMPRPVLCCEP